jgi:hypothetical protein
LQPQSALQKDRLYGGLFARAVEPNYRSIAQWECRAEQGNAMSSRGEATVSGDAETWKPKLFRAAYLAASIGVTIGWLIALSWAGLSVLKLIV